MHIVNTYTQNGAIVCIPIKVSIMDTCIIYRDISKSLDTSYISSRTIEQVYIRILKCK